MSPRPTLLAVLAALIATLAVAGCGSSHSGSSSTALTITPAKPTTSSEIHFAFTAPVAAGTNAKGTTTFSLSATGPSGRSCVGAHEQGGSPVAKGATETISVGPSQLGKPWCAGYYTARVFELHRAPCKQGQVCSQAIAVVGTVAKGSFTVKQG